MVMSFRSYGHLKFFFNNPQQLNDDRSTFFSEDTPCKFFENDCGVKNQIAIDHIKWILAGKEKLKEKRCNQFQVDKMHMAKVMRSARTKWPIFTSLPYLTEKLLLSYKNFQLVCAATFMIKTLEITFMVIIGQKYVG